MNPTVAFLLGIIWEFILALQIRLISGGTNSYSLFITTCVASLVWGYMITGLTIRPSVIPFYAVGSGIGVVCAVYITKYEGKRAKRTKKR